MRRVCMSLTLAVFLPLSAWADPVSVNLHSANGAIVSVSPSTNGLHIDLGQLQLTGAESSALFLFGGLNVYTDYTVLLNLAGSGLDSLTFEVLDIFGDGDDGLDPYRSRRTCRLATRRPTTSTASALRRIPGSPEARCSPVAAPR